MFESIYETVILENTRFIFHTNFSGDPTQDRFGSSARKATIIIPNPEVAHALIDAGYNVKTTKPRQDDDPESFVPEYFVSIQAKYRTQAGVPVQNPPLIYLVTGKKKELLTEETISLLDGIRAKNVDVELNQYLNKTTGRKSLFIRKMYFDQVVDEDPFAAKYNYTDEDDGEDVPF